MFSMEALEAIIREAEFFKRRSKYYKITNKRSYFDFINKHKGQMRVAWEEGGNRYTAEFKRWFTDDEVTYCGVYTKNGKPVQYQKIKNSYRRMLAKKDLTA